MVKNGAKAKRLSVSFEASRWGEKIDDIYEYFYWKFTSRKKILFPCFLLVIFLAPKSTQIFLQLLFSQIFCISGVPHRFVEVEDNQPTFFRGSVEHSEYSPLDDDRKGSLRDAAADFEEEDEAQFSRAAVESIPTTK